MNEMGAALQRAFRQSRRPPLAWKALPTEVMVTQEMIDDAGPASRALDDEWHRVFCGSHCGRHPLCGRSPGAVETT